MLKTKTKAETKPDPLAELERLANHQPWALQHRLDFLSTRTEGWHGHGDDMWVVSMNAVSQARPFSLGVPVRAYGPTPSDALAAAVTRLTQLNEANPNA